VLFSGIIENDYMKKYSQLYIGAKGIRENNGKDKEKA